MDGGLCYQQHSIIGGCCIQKGRERGLKKGVYVSLSMCVDAGMGGLGEWGETLFFSFFLTVSYNWPRKATCVLYT